MTLNMEAQKPNGGEIPAEVQALPASRQAAWAQSNLYFQEVADERDRLRNEVMHLKSDIAGFKVALEAMQAQLTEAQSRENTALLMRDEAVSRRVELETGLEVMMATGRAIQIKNAPVVRSRDDDGIVSIGGA